MHEKLNATLPNLKYDVLDHLPDFESYTVKKFHSDYRKSLEKNDYRGIFIFFDAIEIGVGLHSEQDEFIKALIRISSLIDVTFLSDQIGKYSPILILFVCETLSKEKLLELIEKYKDENIFPLLVAARILFKKNRIEEMELDWVFIEKCCIVLEKIKERIFEDSLYKYVLNNIGILISKEWHVTYTTFVVKNPKILDDYSNNINFRSDKYGLESFHSSNQYGTMENLDIVSVNIYRNFILFLKDNDYYQHPFYFSTYINYFLQAIFLISDRNYKKYLSEIEKISICLLRCLYSWNLKEKNILFTKWIYWIMAAKNFKNSSINATGDLKMTYKILNDPKIMNLLKFKNNDTSLDFSELKVILESPENVSKIKLPTSDGVIEITWI